MRDPTRGGLATVMHDIARVTDLAVRLQETAIPIRKEVTGVCDILGYNPLFLACEGRVVAVAEPAAAQRTLAAWHMIDAGKEAALIGRVARGNNIVIIETDIGGERLLNELEGDPLPRIC
jgi:hydrogenase expression/formation protein HypE